jgi:biotin synthase-like enzyme
VKQITESTINQQQKKEATMIIVTGDGQIKKDRNKAQVVAEFKAAKARGDRFCSVTGAYAAGLDPQDLERAAGYRGASEKEIIAALNQGAAAGTRKEA